MIGVDYASVDSDPPPDCAAAFKAGVRFAFLRASWGTLIDPIVRRDRAKWREAGATVGVYVYCRVPKVGGPSVASPVVQMRAACDAIGELDHRDFPVVLDVEEESPALDPRALHNWYHDAWKTLADRYGVAPIEYTSARYQHEVLHDFPPGEMNESPLWLAWYPVKEHVAAVFNPIDGVPPIPRSYGDADDCWIWQRQGDAIQVPGFTPASTVDINVFRGIARGGRGDRVRWLQRRLGADVDGRFGGQTHSAVVALQSTHGLVGDGVVGPKTFASLCWIKR